MRYVLVFTPDHSDLKLIISFGNSISENCFVLYIVSRCLLKLLKRVWFFFISDSWNDLCIFRMRFFKNRSLWRCDMYLYLRFKKLPCGQNMALHVVCTTMYWQIVTLCLKSLTCFSYLFTFSPSSSVKQHNRLKYFLKHNNIPGDFRVIVCPTLLQMNDFCDLLGTPDAPVSKIASVKERRWVHYSVSCALWVGHQSMGLLFGF